MARKAISSAAGALLGALIAGLPAAPALGQTTLPELRGSLGQDDPSAATGEDEATGVSADGLPLGGLGDEPEPPAAPTAATLGATAPARSIAEPGEPPPIRPLTPLPPRPEDLDPYAPVGMRVGSFRLFPELQFGTVLTDNVLTTRTDTRSDIGAEVIPRLRLESTWNRHRLAAEFNADQIFYQDFSSENVDNWQALVQGRIDVRRRTFIELEAEASRTREGRNAAQLPDAALAREDLREQHVTAALSHTFNRLTLRLSQTFADFDYSDVTFITDPPIPGDVRDYREALTILRGSYEFKPGVAAIVEAAFNDRDFRQAVDEAGNRQGSSGFELQGGMNVRIGPALTGEITAGFAWQQPTETALSEIEAFIINADLTWQPTPLTRFRFDARSDIDETTVVDASGAIDRFYQLSVEHALRRNLILGAFANYETADYVGDPLFEQRVRYGLTGEYLLSREVAILARYEHTDFISTNPESEYVENEFKIGMRIRR